MIWESFGITALMNGRRIMNDLSPEQGAQLNKGLSGMDLMFSPVTAALDSYLPDEKAQDEISKALDEMEDV